MTLRIPVSTVGAVESTRRIAGDALGDMLTLGNRLQSLLTSAELPRVAKTHGLSTETFKELVTLTAHGLLGLPGAHGEQRVDGRPSLERLNNEPFPKQLLESATKDWKRGIPQRSPEERAKLNQQMANAIREVQASFAAKENRQLERGQHAKAILGVTNARFEVRPDLPKELQFGPFKPGADWRTLIRFSNAPSSVAGDDQKARRGIALRMTDDQGHSQDLLMTTGSAAFLAKDGPAAVAAAKAEMQGALGLVGLAKELGPSSTAKLLFAAKTTGAKDESLAASTFFSRVPYQLGDYAVKFRLVPVEPDSELHGSAGGSQLTNDARARLKEGPITYVLEAQFNRRPEDMGDARIDWDSPYVPLGKLTVPQQDLTIDAARENNAVVDDLSFKPWNRWDDSDDRALRPLGDVNEARKAIYEASSENRGSGGVQNRRCPMGYA